MCGALLSNIMKTINFAPHVKITMQDWFVLCFMNFEKSRCCVSFECCVVLFINHETYISCPRCETTHAGLVCSRFGELLCVCV
jgi:hypothetical protein